MQYFTDDFPGIAGLYGMYFSYTSIPDVSDSVYSSNVKTFSNFWSLSKLFSPFLKRHNFKIEHMLKQIWQTNRIVFLWKVNDNLWILQ